MQKSSQQSSTLVVGLTGSIGSGKTEVSNIFSELGSVVIDADLLAREAVQPGCPALKEITDKFGSEILNKSGELNRVALGKIVFSSQIKRKEIEQIIHPQVRKLFSARLSALKSSAQLSSPLIIYVVPLLFEAEYDFPELESIIVVSAARAECIERIVQRDKCSLELAERKYDSQLPIKDKIEQADYVIHNDGDLKSLRSQVENLYSKLVNEN